jgi:hypothetical protein
MARCDEGYPCVVCGNDVTSVVESDLYLRFVIGELDPELLHTASERHLRCNPVLSQFIVHDQFESIEASGLFNKRNLDSAFVAERTKLVSRGFARLLEIAATDYSQRDVTQYPLDEVVHRYR